MARAKKPKKPRKPTTPAKPKKPGPSMGIGDFMREQFEERRDKPAKPGNK